MANSKEINANVFREKNVLDEALVAAFLQSRDLLNVQVSTSEVVEIEIDGV